MIKFHFLGTYLWNWSIDRKHEWLFKLFPNKICVSFTNGDEPIRAKDLWDNHSNLKSLLKKNYDI